MKNKGKHSEELIRLEAYLLSERAGHPPGMDAIFWAQAEALVRERKSVGGKASATPTGTKKTLLAKTASATVVTKPAAIKKGTAAKPPASDAPAAKAASSRAARQSKTQDGADRSKLDA